MEPLARLWNRGPPLPQLWFQASEQTPSVMAGLVPAIHVLQSREKERRMPGTRPGMTSPFC
jgi:hypothetical protein